MVQEPQWMLKTVNSTKPYIYYVFSYTYIPMINFNLYIRHNNRLITKIVRTIITKKYCNKNYVTVASLRIYFTHPGDVRRYNTYMMKCSEVNDIGIVVQH